MFWPLATMAWFFVILTVFSVFCNRRREARTFLLVGLLFWILSIGA